MVFRFFCKVLTLSYTLEIQIKACYEMKNGEKENFLEDKLENLEQSVNLLLKKFNELKEENESIKHTNKQLMLERSELQNKNDKVRGQVEAMVDRLKALDKAS